MEGGREVRNYGGKACEWVRERAITLDRDQRAQREQREERESLSSLHKGTKTGRAVSPTTRQSLTQPTA